MLFKRESKRVEEILQLDVFKRTKAKRYTELIVGVIILALTFNFFMFPIKIISGFSGVVIIINKLTGISSAQTILTFTIVLLIIGWFTIC